MDSRKLPVVVSEKYRDDLKNIFQYGVETFGVEGAIKFYDNIEAIAGKLGSMYYMYPECRFLPTKTMMYRNIILESYLIIYRIAPMKIEILRAFHASVCTSHRIQSVRKIRI